MVEGVNPVVGVFFRAIIGTENKDRIGLKAVVVEVF